MHLYVGWTCKTPGCGDEIPFKYLGEEPLRDKTTVTFPAVTIVKCRKCGRIHEYSHERPRNFLHATRLPENPKSN